MIQLILNEIYEWMQAFVGSIPGLTGFAIRRAFYKIYLKQVGRRFVTGRHGRIDSPQAVSIGNNSGFNDNFWVVAHPQDGRITIGDHVLIGPYAILHTGNHIFDRIDIPITQQRYKFAPIVIEDDVWIGARVVVLAGVTLRTGTVVGAGAVVTHSTERYSIVAGVPARPIGSRCAKD